MYNTRKQRVPFWVKAGIFAPIGIAVAVLIFGLVVMLLWNALVPAIFGLGVITFWQALGILVLSKILFGGFGFHRRPGRTDHYKYDRWRNMSQEEREKMKTEWRNRCRPERKADESVSPESKVE